MDFDVRPILRRLTLPILLILGQGDLEVPAGTTADIWRSCLGPDLDVTMVSIRGMGHSPVSADQNDLGEAGQVRAEYERVLIGWLQDRLSSTDRR